MVYLYYKFYFGRSLVIINYQNVSGARASSWGFTSQFFFFIGVMYIYRFDAYSYWLARMAGYDLID